MQTENPRRGTHAQHQPKSASVSKFTSLHPNHLPPNLLPLSSLSPPPYSRQRPQSQLQPVTLYTTYHHHVYQQPSQEDLLQCVLVAFARSLFEISDAAYRTRLFACTSLLRSSCADACSLLLSCLFLCVCAVGAGYVGSCCSPAYRGYFERSP